MKSQHQDVPNQSLNYIYFPFLKNECSERMLERLWEFKKKNAKSMKDGDKSYHILIYAKGKIFADGKNLSSLPLGAKIYVIGLGIDLTSVDRKGSLLKHLPEGEHQYAVSGGEQAVSIKTIAERMITDGLLESKNFTIKLWFGDCNNRAELIANKFTDCLQKYDLKSKFTIDYYPNAILHAPHTHEGKKRHWVIDSKTEERKRASKMRYSLLFDCSKHSSDQSSESASTEKSVDFVDSISNGVSSFFARFK